MSILGLLMISCLVSNQLKCVHASSKIISIHDLKLFFPAMTENKLIVHENGTEEWYKEFDWDTKQQGLVLSSFFYGYICTQFIGGIIAAKIGGHIVSIII